MRVERNTMRCLCSFGELRFTVGAGDTNLSLPLGDAQRSAALDTGEIAMGIAVAPTIFLQINELLRTLAPFQIPHSLLIPFCMITGEHAINCKNHSGPGEQGKYTQKGETAQKGHNNGRN